MMMHPHRRRKAMQLHPRPPSIVLHLYDVVRTICSYGFVIAGSLESAYSLIWGSHKIWGKGGGDTLDLL